MLDWYVLNLFIFCDSRLQSLFCSVSVFSKYIRYGILLISSSIFTVLCIGIANVYSKGFCVKVISNGGLSIIRGLLSAQWNDILSEGVFYLRGAIDDVRL